MLNVKPPGKYPGNKFRVADTIKSFIPNHVWRGATEVRIPFGGMCGFITKTQPKSALITELDHGVTSLYYAIQESPSYLMKELETWYNMFKYADAHGLGEELYKGVRDSYNASNIKSAALWLVINKVGFNGLMRYNKAGGLNTPYGKRRFPRQDYDNIKKLNLLYRDWIFINDDFRACFTYRTNGRVIYYADPPFVGTFNAYTTARMTANDHVDLAKLLVNEHVNKGHYVILSSANNRESRELYSGTGLVPYVIAVNKSISRDASGRGLKTELLWLPDGVVHTGEQYVMV